jgi:hypothetical protein
LSFAEWLAHTRHEWEEGSRWGGTIMVIGSIGVAVCPIAGPGSAPCVAIAGGITAFGTGMKLVSDLVVLGDDCVNGTARACRMAGWAYLNDVTALIAGPGGAGIRQWRIARSGQGAGSGS